MERLDYLFKGLGIGRIVIPEEAPIDSKDV
jgi:hypothetical protein